MHVSKILTKRGSLQRGALIVADKLILQSITQLA